MSQDNIQILRDLYQEWIKDSSTRIDYLDFFDSLISYTSDVEKDICGKCTPCRDGIPVIKQYINMFDCNNATKDNLKKLESYVKNLRSSKCSVGLDYGKTMEVILSNNFNNFYRKVR